MFTYISRLTSIIGACLVLAAPAYSQGVSKITNPEIVQILSGISDMQTFETEDIMVTVFKVTLETDTMPKQESHESYTRLYVIIAEIGTYAKKSVYLVSKLVNVDKVFFQKLDKTIVTIDFLEGNFTKRRARVLKINSETLSLELLK